MAVRDIFAVVAGLLAIVAAIPYIIDIIKGKTKPNIASWLTWTLLLLIGTAGAFAAHEVRSALLTTGDLVGTGLILLLGVKYGIAEFSKFDFFCQAGALLGLVLWFVFNSPTIGIVAVIAVDLLGSLPTLRHSWKNPKEETWQTFVIVSLASVITLITLTNFNVASLAYPGYLLVINLSFASVVIYRRVHLGISLGSTGKSGLLHG